MSDIIIITIADEDYVDSFFSDSQSSKDKASQTFAVRSKTDKCPSTNNTQFLDVYAKRHQLDNAVRVKQERKARTQSPKRDKKYKRSCKHKHISARRLQRYNFVPNRYYPTFCWLQRCENLPCVRPCLLCSECPYSI